MNKCLLILLLLAQTPDQKILRERLAQDVTKGDTLAWARHKTGINQDDEFESVAVIAGSGGEDETWIVVNRTINGVDYRFVEQFQPFDFGDQNDAWFVDAGLGGTSNGVAEVPSDPGVSTTYALTFISENVTIWGVPVGDGELGRVLSGSANNEGGGIVSLPMANNPYTSGMVVKINNTTNYDGNRTLTAGTSTTQLHFAATFSSESFNGNETVVRLIANLGASAGRMDADSGVANMYFGHTWDAGNSTYVLRIENDGTEHTDAVTFSTIPGPATTCLGLKLSADDGSLHVLSEAGLWKFDLSDGSETWFNTNAVEWDMDVDSLGRVYAAVPVISRENINQFASADGAATPLTLMGEYAAGANPFFGTIYDVHVDNDLGLVMQGGEQTGIVPGDASALYNFSVRTFDNVSGDQLQIGGTFLTLNDQLDQTYTIGTGMITSNGVNIYVLIVTGAGREIFKYSWSGTSLTQEAQVAGPPHGSGIYVDLYGNIVAVNNDGTDDDILWFYDSDLNFLSKIENLHFFMLDQWLAGVGNTWQSGNAVFDGVLGSDPIPSVPGVDPNFIAAEPYPVDVNLCVYADGVPIGNFVTEADANGTIVLDLGAEYDTVIAGINYYSVYESFLLAPKNTMIKSVTLDFFETLGAHVGVDQTFSADLKFSYDDFATRQDMVTGWKYATWLRGTTFDPRLYLWHWNPTPLTLRGAYLDMEITNE